MEQLFLFHIKLKYFFPLALFSHWNHAPPLQLHCLAFQSGEATGRRLSSRGFTLCMSRRYSTMLCTSFLPWNKILEWESIFCPRLGPWIGYSISPVIPHPLVVVTLKYHNHEHNLQIRVNNLTPPHQRQHTPPLLDEWASLNCLSFSAQRDPLITSVEMAFEFYFN